MKNVTNELSWAMLATIGFSSFLRAASPPPEKPPFSAGKDGHITYDVAENGDRVPDFSYAGYAGGEKSIPDVPIKLVVSPIDGDNTARIQAAIDQVGKMPLDEHGFRGTILLSKGEFKIDGGLNLNASGVVLRGSGANDDGTKLIATGTDRRTLIHIVGGDDRKVDKNEIPVADDHVPVDSLKLKLQSVANFKVGDMLVIHRPSTKEWIVAMGMDDLGGDRHGPSWRPGSRDLYWDRSITAIDGDSITLDAPITCALDSKYGGGTVAKYDWPGRITNVGVENLSCDSQFNSTNPKDEDHSWFCVCIDRAADVWVRQINSKHFAASAVAAWESTKRITVEDCKSTDPIGEIGGWRRDTFFTNGQQVLMQRCYCEDGVHPYSVGFAAPGPNAFVQCDAVRALGESGSIESWACGTLFDRVRIDGNELTLRNRTYQGQGTGWAAANSVLYNSLAAVIECWKPPTAQNWAVGTWGEFAGNGDYYSSNEYEHPDSLYYAQLMERLGKTPQDVDNIRKRTQLVVYDGETTTSPKPEVVAALIKRGYQPAVQTIDLINDAAKVNPINIDPGSAPKLDEASVPKPYEVSTSKALSIQNGWLVADGAILSGEQLGVPWWNQSARPGDFEKAPPALTRFVPGRTGLGLTDDIDELATWMTTNNRVALSQTPPLWYDRRRDDHERGRRMDGDVVAPFYEFPVARSGQGVANDGLSKYDLTKPNPWYFSRLEKFADVATADGLVLFNQHYMQHNIIEDAAHYADFPWRPINNINSVPLPEPPYQAGDKRVFIGEQFYDITRPHMAELHRAYIRHQLDALGDKNNVVQLTSQEYTGDLRFIQFWLDTIAQWEEEHQKPNVLVGLYATKDVTDAILADPIRSKIVKVIFNRYNYDAGWWYMPSGELYAPKGGQNLSPRQHERLYVAQHKGNPANAGPEQVAKAIREYRTKYPDKAFVYVAGESANSQMGWATLMSGGSLPPIDHLDPKIAKLVPTMHTADGLGVPALADEGQKNLLCYCAADEKPSIDLGGYAQKEFELDHDAMLLWLTKK